MKIRSKIFFLLIVAIFAAIYNISYKNIMDVEVRARNDERFGSPPSQCFSSSAKYLPKYYDKFTLAGGSVVILEYREICLWNYIFFPADLVRAIMNKFF